MGRLAALDGEEVQGRQGAAANFRAMRVVGAALRSNRVGWRCHISWNPTETAAMEPSIGAHKIVRESVEQFTGDIDLGGCVCTLLYQERVLWVETLAAVTVLKHRGALIDELGRYEAGPSESDPGSREAIRIAKWASSAMKIDQSSELLVEVWRVSRAVPMVERDGSMVPAPNGMMCMPDFVDSAWSSEAQEEQGGASLIWSSKWAAAEGVEGAGVSLVTT